MNKERFCEINIYKKNVYAERGKRLLARLRNNCFCFYFSGDWLTKVYEYAHEYQICTVLSAAEERLCEKVKNIKTDSYFYNDMPMNKLFDLLVFGERYSMSKLILTAANKFSAIPGRYVRNCNIYRSLSYHLKFLIADARLKKTDTDTYYSEKE